jgi:hypothetical protein
MLCITNMRRIDAVNRSLVCENKQPIITGGYRSTTRENGVNCTATGGTAGGWCVNMTMTQRGASDAASMYHQDQYHDIYSPHGLAFTDQKTVQAKCAGTSDMMACIM